MSLFRREVPSLPTPAELAESLVLTAELQATILDTVVGFRAKCLANGFSETAAEAMAVDFHRALLP